MTCLCDYGRPIQGSGPDKDSDLGRSTGLGPELSGLVPMHKVKDLSVSE